MVIDMYQPFEHIYQSNNAAATATNHYGSLKLTVSTDKIVTSKPVVMHEIPFKVAVTVKDILDFIQGRNLQYYKFHEKSSGCLFWQLTLLERFAEKGWIPASTQEIKNKIEAFRNVSPVNAAMIPYPPVQGTFYQPPVRDLSA